MFAIENCYRIIFEAMLEDSIFMCIAKRIEEYTGAGVAFVAGTGKVLACSCICAKLFPVSAGKGHLTFEDYGLIRDRQELDGRLWCVTPVYGGKIAIGYVVLMYGEKEEEGTFQELGGILAQNVKRYFQEEQKQYLFCQPLNEHMAGWTLFEEDASGFLEKYGFPVGSYLVVSFFKKEGRLAAVLRGLWKCLYIYEERDEIFVLLYQVKSMGLLRRKKKAAVSVRCFRISVCLRTRRRFCRGWRGLGIPGRRLLCAGRRSGLCGACTRIRLL